MKLEKLLSVSFPQILGVRHPRIKPGTGTGTRVVSIFFLVFRSKLDTSSQDLGRVIIVAAVVNRARFRPVSPTVARSFLLWNGFGVSW